jgi:DNA polymerase
MITIDFETRSRAEIGDCGASGYARHHSTVVLCLVYLIGDKCTLWTPDQPPPRELFEAIEAGELIEGHNVFFERNIWHHVCHKRMGWPDVPFDQWRCSMAKCCRSGWPRGLGAAAEAVQIQAQKDHAGGLVMLQLAKPKKPSSKDPHEFYGDRGRFEVLYDYCVQDVKTEHALSEALPALSERETRIWQLDQRINLRGVCVDVEAVRHAIAIVERYTEQCKKELEELTDGQVKTARQVAEFKRWIAGVQGQAPPDLRAATVDKWLKKDLDPRVRRALELRKATAKSSVAKLQKILHKVEGDGRVRGNLVYHGARTGRWAGSGLQVQNFVKGY